ncbi:hypothetical protein ABZV58_31610 [Nocardia sp. NPDC004654]|uniref:hypothetical protein n=1 Tax=Nocardia sp. NPDC004654 TaxID=3154776 RepID=UPI0033B62F01
MTAEMGGTYSRLAAVGETTYVPGADEPNNDEVQYDVEAGLARLRSRLGFDRKPRRPSENQANQLRKHQDPEARLVTTPTTQPAPRTVEWPTAARFGEVAARMDALVIAPLRISSAISPEVAVRLGDGEHGERWTLSWLPEMVLNRQQALSAMVLDEILTDPQELDSATIMRILRHLADELGMPLERVLVRLSSVKTDCRRTVRSRRVPLTQWDSGAAMAREA